MPSHKLSNYLRTYRRRVGFTQDQVAFLLGCKSGVEISRHERMKSTPRLRLALAYQVIFKVSLETLFSGEFQKVEKCVARRATTLLRRLAKTQELDEHTRQILATISAK